MNLIVFNVSVIASVVRNVPRSLCCSEVGVCCHGEVRLLHIKIFRHMRAPFHPRGRVAGAHCRSTRGPVPFHCTLLLLQGSFEVGLRSTSLNSWRDPVHTWGGIRSNFMVSLEHRGRVQRNGDPAEGISEPSELEEVVPLLKQLLEEHLWRVSNPHYTVHY